MSFKAVRSRLSFGLRSRHTVTTADITSTLESSPNPINEIELASEPAEIATIASTTLQAIVAHA